MAQIIKQKDDNVVAFIFDEKDTLTLDADQLAVSYTGKIGSEVDMIAPLVNSTTHEIVSGVTPPTRFYGGGFTTYDGSSFTVDTTALNARIAEDPAWVDPPILNIE